MNPALSGGAATGGMVGSGMNRGLRDRLIGVLVTVVKGPQKGYVGTIKDTNGPRHYREGKAVSQKVSLSISWPMDLYSSSNSKDSMLEPLGWS